MDLPHTPDMLSFTRPARKESHHVRPHRPRRRPLHATPRQREVIGFPAPGHAFWNAETLEGTARRYPKMDMTPYREAFREAAPLVTAG